MCVRLHMLNNLLGSNKRLSTLCNVSFKMYQRKLPMNQKSQEKNNN